MEVNWGLLWGAGGAQDWVSNPVKFCFTGSRQVPTLKKKIITTQAIPSKETCYDQHITPSPSNIPSAGSTQYVHNMDYFKINSSTYLMLSDCVADIIWITLHSVPLIISNGNGYHCHFTDKVTEALKWTDWDNWRATHKRMNLDPYLIPYMKVSSKQIKDLEV